MTEPEERSYNKGFAIGAVVGIVVGCFITSIITVYLCEAFMANDPTPAATDVPGFGTPDLRGVFQGANITVNVALYNNSTVYTGENRSLPVDGWTLTINDAGNFSGPLPWDNTGNNSTNTGSLFKL